MFYLVCIIIHINLYNLLPSDDIWNKMLKYMEEGKMIYSPGKNYFIFDESNYTALDINGDKMSALYTKQNNLYNNYRIPNYIFAVDKQDENLEIITDATSNLASRLKSEFKIESDNAIIYLFSKETNRTRLRLGETIRRKIGDSKAKIINSNIQNNLKKGNYYGAWNRFIDDIVYYTKLESDSSSSSSSSNSNSSEVDVKLIILPIISFILILIFIFCFCREFKLRKKEMIEKNNNFRKVGKFVKENRNNQAIFTDYCALCLEKLRNEPFQEIKTEAGIIVSPQGIKANNINTFNCGHQFHANCITEFKIGECPICKQRENPKYNQENAKIIWGIHTGLCPILKGYNYNDINSINFDNKIPNNISATNINNDTHSHINNSNDYYHGPDSVSNISPPSYNANDNGPSCNPSIHGSGGAVGGW